MPDPRLQVLAALLAQGRTVHLTAGVLTLGAWGFGSFSLLLCAGVAVVFGVETWFAARVGLDATLFDALASGTGTTSLDRGLVGLGLMKERGPRSVDARIKGAIRLWRWQLVLLMLQACLFLGALVGSLP